MNTKTFLERTNVSIMAVIKEEHQGINELRRMHYLEAINI